jgi:aspartate 1-decarboxylase
MFRKLLKSKIHRATVTCSDMNYEGSIAVDAALLEAADIQPFEAVHVWNISNGSRLETYALPVGRGSGEICMNGAAARLAQAGDLIIVASFTWLDEKEASAAQPKLVFVDARNHIVEKHV